MKIKETTTTAADGKELHTRLWLPDESPDAALLIVHGMGEHSVRYADFANVLNGLNIAVVAYDHRGHGFTDQGNKGVVPVEDAYQQMADDIGLMRDSIKQEFPECPEFLFAHSMGSFLTMRHLQVSSDNSAPAGVIYSGSSGAVSPLLPFGILFSAALKTVAGDSYKSDLLRDMVFKPYNRSFKPTRTRHDWITRDPDAVDRYIADPNCGFTPSVSFLNHFFKGLRKTQRHQPFSGPTTYPVLIVAGSEDPISKPVNGIEKLQEKLRNSGITSLDTLIYDGGRHEMLSELNKEEVMEDIEHWLEQMLKNVTSDVSSS